MRKKEAGVCLAWIGAFLGTALQQGLSCQSSPQIPLRKGLAPLPSCLPVGGTELALGEVGKSNRVDVHAVANLNHLKAHSEESVTLGPLGLE